MITDTAGISLEHQNPGGSQAGRRCRYAVPSVIEKQLIMEAEEEDREINRVIAERVWKEREQQPKREYKVDGRKFMALGLRLNK